MRKALAPRDAPQIGPIPLTSDLTFEDFYRREYEGLVRTLGALTGRWALAEELAQEAMLAAHRRWEQIGVYDRPDLWVRRIGMNRAISAHRRVLAEVAALARVRVESSVELPELRDQRVWAAVHRLPRRQAAALLLSSIERRTAAEIGEVLGCSEETARTHVRRAKATLAKSLAADAEGGE
jgi:RNA polymerase sigma factor (sigma-70 family)